MLYIFYRTFSTVFSIQIMFDNFASFFLSSVNTVAEVPSGLTWNFYYETMEVGYTGGDIVF